MFYLFVDTIADTNYVQINCDLKEIGTLKKIFTPEFKKSCSMS